MWIRTLECRNFRNYDYVRLDPDPGINIITGQNAQGKTNLLEAIYLSGTAKSHRASRDREMIRFGEPEGHIRAEVIRNDVPFRVDIHLKRAGGKGIAVNGVPIRRTSELYGLVNVVFFSPEDLSIIKDAPVTRRSFCDMELCQLSPIYVDDLIHYNKAVMQRNALLRDLPLRRDYEAMLPAWEEQLVRYGVPVIRARREFVEELSRLVEPIHRKLTGERENILVTYEPNVTEDDFAQRLFLAGETDRRAKTTTCGPHRDDIGFSVDGVDIRKIKLSSLRSRFGQMLQDVFLFSGDIRGNLTLRRQDLTDGEILEACRYVNANAFIDKLPGGLDEPVRERGNNFSAGQRQLLSFARTILQRPRVIILDEATANIDTETELLIQDSLERIRTIGTMLVVAHRLSTIQHADNIIVLDHGVITEQGDHQTLLARRGRYYRLYTLQYQKQALERGE